MLAHEDKRLNLILDKIGKMAALEFLEELETSEQNDVVDAIILGLNMLSEELHSNMVEKSKLHRVNDKLERFALTAAHDLKSPINGMTGLLNLLEYSIRYNNKEETEQYLALLKSTTEKMKELVIGILDYSRHSPSDLEMETIALSEVINDIVLMDRVDRFAKLNVTSLPSVPSNKSALMQVFRNIFSNAIKYNDKEICEIHVRAIEHDNHFELQVKDNGPGIAPENHTKIFQLFNRVEMATDADSHGVGLASVKSILTSFNEKIWVDSEPGKGATFCFTLKKKRL
jgi:signal transduction histidine kinase